MSARSTFAHIDLAALQSNFRAIAEFLGSHGGNRRAGLAVQDPPYKSPGVIAVVKANAYGHGASAVGVALQEAGATILACADIEEAIVLREAGVSVEILVFGALSVSDVEGIFEYNLTPTISTPGAGRSLQAAAATHHTRLRCHLKIDTGMNRLGLRYDNLEFTLPALVASTNLEIGAVYTHFATADDPDYPLFQTQRERFDQVLTRLPQLGINPQLTHAANSARRCATRVWHDLVRPGLLI
jgi:alanine racemase